MENLKGSIISNLAYWLSCLSNSSLNLKVQNEARLAEIKESGRNIIFALWHEHLWLPVYYLSKRDCVTLASESRDGEYITGVLERLDWEVVRGSTSQGGTRSLLRLIKRLKQGQEAAITVDGPTGPRREVKPGIYYLAKKTESVVIPVGVAFKRKKVFNSWDRFKLPAPFTKAVLTFGAGIMVEAESSEDAAYYQELIGDQINAAIKEAEEMLGGLK
ncbi:MAG: lysophospholipid acyltransferase family protein [Halanaerobacter sp.]